MTGLYIGSVAPRAGKSLLSFSLGLLLQKAGYSVGYMKPLGRLLQKVDEVPGDADALVVQEVLGQSAPPDALTPVLIPANLHALALFDEAAQNALPRIASAYAEISRGRDVTLVSGCGAFPETGRFCGAPGLAVVRELGLKTLLVERFHRTVNYDSLLYLKDLLGPALIGVVLNDVPENVLREATQVLAPYLAARGVTVHGIVPREPGLAAMRVSDLSQGLSGCIVAANALAGREVKGFLIGTMQVDNFMMYLRNSPESAVIVGGDRADLQLAALHAAAPCVILTGNIAPTELVRAKAEKAGVPLVSVREDTYTVARSTSFILKSKKLRDLRQIKLGAALVDAAVNKESLHEALFGR